MINLTFKCPHCTQAMEAPPEMFGSEIECPVCSKLITIPSVLDVAKGALAKCPSCQMQLPHDAVLCTNCGMNQKTGKMLNGSEQQIVRNSPINESPFSVFRGNAREYLQDHGVVIAIAGVVATVVLAFLIVMKFGGKAMEESLNLRIAREGSAAVHSSAMTAPAMSNPVPAAQGTPQQNTPPTQEFVAPSSIKGTIRIVSMGQDLPLKNVPVYLIPFTDDFRHEYNQLGSEVRGYLRQKLADTLLPEVWTRLGKEYLTVQAVVRVEKRRVVLFRVVSQMKGLSFEPVELAQS